MEFITEPNRIYAKSESGEMLAEVTFPAVSDRIVNIDHTFVHPSLRGQGVAGKLIRSAVDQIRAMQWKTSATCAYAIDWFSKHPEHSDIYIHK